MSFLKQLSKYTATEFRTQEENLLTEWLAETLRHCPSFAERFLQETAPELISITKADGGDSSVWKIETQRRYGDAQPDLVIRSRDWSRILAVEIKWDQEPDAEQLRRHLKAVREAIPAERMTIILLNKPAELCDDVRQLISGPPFRHITWRDVWRWATDVKKQIHQSDREAKLDLCRGEVLIDYLLAHLEAHGMMEPGLSLQGLASAYPSLEFNFFVREVLNQTSSSIRSNYSDFFVAGRGNRESMPITQYVEHGRWTVFFKIANTKVWLAFGVLINMSEWQGFAGAPVELQAKAPWAATWVEFDSPKLRRGEYLELHNRLDQFVKDQPGEWYFESSPSSKEAAYRLKPMSDYLNVQDAARELGDWYLANSRMLNDAEIFQLAIRLGAGAADSASDDEVDEDTI